MNNKGIPPVPSKERNVLQGSGEYKVITLGLQEVVKEGLDKGMGVNKLAKEINEGLLKDSNVKISGMGILRWSKEHYNESQRESTGSYAVNIFSHYDDILKILTEQIEIQQSLIDDLRKESAESTEDSLKYSKALSALNTSLEKYISKKLVLLGTIGTIQEKIYGYARATEVLEMTLGVVKEEGIELYSKVMGKLRENPEYLQLLKKIMPDKR